MTREEQIAEAAMLEAYKKRTIQEAYNCELDFAAGAAWADAHPDNGLGFEPKPLEECIEAATPTWQGVDVEKYIDEVRGRDEQPVDLRYMAGIYEPLKIEKTYDKRN